MMKLASALVAGKVERQAAGMNGGMAKLSLNACTGWKEIENFKFIGRDS